MAEGDGVVYNSIRMEMAKILETNEIKMILVAAGYTPDIDTHVGYADVTNECANGLGYTTGGVVLTGKSVTLDPVTDRVLFNCNDVLWASLGTLNPQPAWAIAYDNTITGKTLVSIWEVVKPTNGGDYSLTISDSPAAALIVG